MRTTVKIHNNERRIGITETKRAAIINTGFKNNKGSIKTVPNEKEHYLLVTDGMDGV